MALLSLALSVLGCAQDATLKPCNIAEQSCQENVYYAVLRLRGDGWDPFAGLPPIRTITLDQYRAELLASAPAPQPQDPNAKPKPDPWGSALQILGLVEAAQSTAEASVDSQVDNVAAFYAPSTRKVTVIDRGQARDDLADTILLAHELVHAFQDRELAGGLSELDTDHGFASHAFIEGEAVLYERLTAQEISQRTLSRVQWQQYYGTWLSGLRMAMPQQRSPFFAAPWFVYPLGGGLLTQGWLDGGNAAVRRLQGGYPQSSEQYMADATDAGVARVDDHAPQCALAPAVGSFAGAGRDRFGAIQFYAFLTRAGVEESAAWELALGWRNDNLGIYFDRDSEHTLAVWRLRLTDASTAQSAADRILSDWDATRAPLSVTALDSGELQIAGSDQPEWTLDSEPSLGCTDH